MGAVLLPLPTILTSVLCFLGLPVGRFLANLAKDEVPLGRRHFTILRVALTAIILWLGIEQFLTTPLGLFGVVTGVTLILSRRNLFSLAYPLWGLLLGLNMTNDIALLAGCIFLYGLVEAALRFDSKPLIRTLDFAFFILLGVGILL